MVPNWHLCPTIGLLFSGEADWLLCQNFVGILKNSSTFLVYFLVQVVKIASFVQQVDQWHPSVGFQVNFHLREEIYQSLIFRRVQRRSGQIPRVTKSLANSAVRAGIGITTTVGRLSTGSFRACKGLPLGNQKILVILHSHKSNEVHLQLRLTLLSGVFVCDCEIDISNWCIQIVGSEFPHSRLSGIKMSVVNNRLKFPVLTFNVIRGRVHEYSFNKRITSWFGWANEGCYLVVVSKLSCYHEIFCSSDKS